MIAADSWTAEIAHAPLKALAALIGVLIITTGAGFVLRRLNRRSRSLRRQVLAITIVALVLGAISASALSWLMVLDSDELGIVLSVLGITAVTAAGLVLVASSPLGHDVTRLASTVRRIERGERTIAIGIERRDELGQVAVALDELTQRLGALERERAHFENERSVMLSSVSHDLRTPIAALQAAIEAMADGLAPEPDRYLSSMQRDIEALASLVDDLFLLVRLDNGRLEMPATSIDLTEIIDEAIEALTPVASNRGITLRVDSPGGVRLRGNAAALGRVIRNLLDNAIRHAPDSSTVTVAIDPDTRRVRVIDEGIGFPAAFAGQAFDHFTRADASRNRDTGGAGLGLAIARGVVEAHGGKIWIEAPPGGHVAFELPAA